MEPKKIKKLMLKKETISNLSNDEMTHQKGGFTGLKYLCPIDTQFACPPASYQTCDFFCNMSPYDSWDMCYSLDTVCNCSK